MESKAESGIQNLVKELTEHLVANNCNLGGVNTAADTMGEEELWEFLVSNTLWGGAGSIADQALLEIPDARRRLEEILIRLGHAQLAIARINVRTESWVDFFEKLHKSVT